MPDNLAVLSARVRSARKSRGLSQEALAKAAGVAEGTVARVERGEKVRPGNLYAIRVTLGVEDDTPETPDSAQLCLDLVRKWLLMQPDVDAAANELTGWVVSKLRD